MAKFVWFILAAFCFCPNVALAQNSVLPQEVASYYEAHNFVAAFSTPQERNVLAAYRSEEELKKRIRSKRLITVYERIQKIKARELSFDPGITFPKSSRAREPIPPGFAQAEHVRRTSDGALIVEILIHGLDSKTNAMLVALYETGERKSFPDDFYKSNAPSRREIHEWVHRNGNWFIKATRIALLDS